MRFGDTNRAAMGETNPFNTAMAGYVPAPVNADFFILLMKSGYTCGSWQSLTPKQKYAAAQTMMDGGQGIPNAVNQYVTSFDKACTAVAVHETTQRYVAQAYEPVPMTATQTYARALTAAAYNTFNDNPYAAPMTQQAYLKKYSGSPMASGSVADLIPTLTADQCNAQTAAAVATAKDTIELTGKNYLAGLVVGGLLGAFAMHLYMGSK